MVLDQLDESLLLVPHLTFKDHALGFYAQKMVIFGDFSDFSPIFALKYL